MASNNRILAITTATLGLVVTSAVIYRLATPPPTLLKEIPPEVFVRQPELSVAYQQYVQNGSKYIWGSNDCSIFVGSYINSCGTVCPLRATTVEIMKPEFMSQVGFQPESGKIKTGDILVFRYRNKSNEWRGHTGVVVWHQDKHWVMHNTASQNGLVMELLPQFLQKAKTLTNNETDLLRTFRRKDFATWYTQFAAKRDKS